MERPVKKRHTEPFLPDITSSSNTRRKRPRFRMQQQEEEEEESLQTRSEPAQRTLSRTEISQFRDSLKQKICLELLQGGFHRSFSELFSLLDSDQNRRAASEPGSDIRLQTPLDQQGDKLETMRVHLIRAEQAERTSSWTAACEQRLFLGQYFSAPEDLWLSLHFYHSCTDQKFGDCSKPATEARVYMAEIYLQQDEVEQARQQVEQCIKQAEREGWTDSDGQLLSLRARRALWGFYSRRANARLDVADHNEALTLLRQGYSIATESKNKQMVADASYQLGLTYQRAGDHGSAKQFFNTCTQICDKLRDAAGLGRCYKAMAKSLESEGNIRDTLKCLEKLVSISRRNGLQHNLVEAFLCLGNIYYTTSQYTRAGEFFLQGYDVACELGDVDLLQKAQVLVGCARAHALIGK